METNPSIQQAVEYVNDGNLTKALEICLAILNSNGDDVDALHVGGIIAFQQNEMDTALNLISKAVELDPTFTAAFLNLGLIYRSLGKTDEAGACFHKVLELDPEQDEAKAYLKTLPDKNYSMSIQEAIQFALTEHQKGNAEAAEIIYRRILEVESNNTDALHLLGVLHAQCGQPNEGIELIKKAIAINPGVPAFYRNLADIYRSA
ncbi:MAG: tetratricopeptide repeat protein, partial [Sulfuricellaceae bacterium]|nr:tetratricopeptide repeat protein [Sulfuricellaceae bacterium]